MSVFITETNKLPLITMVKATMMDELKQLDEEINNLHKMFKDGPIPSGRWSSNDIVIRAGFSGLVFEKSQWNHYKDESIYDVIVENFTINDIVDMKENLLKIANKFNDNIAKEYEKSLKFILGEEIKPKTLASLFE